MNSKCLWTLGIGRDLVKHCNRKRIRFAFTPSTVLRKTLKGLKTRHILKLVFNFSSVLKN